MFTNIYFGDLLHDHSQDDHITVVFLPELQLATDKKGRFQYELVRAGSQFGSRTTSGQRHVNHSPIDHPYKCHENTNHSRVPQLSKAPIPTSK